MKFMRSWPIAFAALVFVYSCGGDRSAGPNPRAPGLRVIAGAGGDTIQARPVQALIVEARGDWGTPASGKVVRFETSFPAKAYVLISSLTSNQFAGFVAVTADDKGKASALLNMGTVAGEAKLLVSVPELGLLDTVRITVLPGAAARAKFTVRDTVLLVGATYSLSAPLVDRVGNPRSETASLVNTTPSLCSVSGSQVTALGMGRCVVEARYQQMRDTARASVLPMSRLAVVSGYNALGITSTDGSAYRKLLSIQDASLSPAWAPDGSALVIYEGDPGYSAKLSIIDTLGTRVRSLGAGVTMASAAFGRFSLDGQWIYFSGRSTGGEPVTIWRMHPDLTQLETVLSSSASFPVSYAWRPSVAPDGQSVAFDVDNKIALVDVTTHQPTALGIPGVAPSFSPDGQHIAFLGPYGDGLRVMNRDGSNVRVVSSAYYYEWQSPQWTSDGSWLLVSSGGQVFVNAVNGALIPLTSVPSYSQAALKPPLGK